MMLTLLVSIPGGLAGFFWGGSMSVFTAGLGHQVLFECGLGCLVAL